MELFYPDREARRLGLAVILSLLLHLSILIATGIRADFSFLRHRKETAKSSDVIRFDFIPAEPLEVVETPQSDKEEVPLKPTNIISDKDTASRDLLEKEEGINEMPHSEGRAEIKDLRKSLPGEESAPEPAVALEPAPPQPSVLSKSEGEENTIEMITPTEEKVMEKEEVASLPKDILRIPLYDDPLSNARGFGEITFNAKKHEVAPYIIKMKKRIEEHWAPPVLFTYYGLTSGETVISFKIMPDGEVKDIKVVREKGDESLKKASIQAIEDASPFDPVPDKILADEKEKYLGITFTFYYIIDKPVEEGDI